MNHKDALFTAASTLNDRANKYGSEVMLFRRISELATTVTNKHITEWDIAMILHCVKLGRMTQNHSYSDNYIDGINYLAFAAQFAGAGDDVASQQQQAELQAEQEIRDMAAKYAPLPNVNDHQL